jgi:hypothetical protein
MHFRKRARNRVHFVRNSSLLYTPTLCQRRRFVGIKSAANDPYVNVVSLTMARRPVGIIWTGPNGNPIVSQLKSRSRLLAETNVYRIDTIAVHLTRRVPKSRSLTLRRHSFGPTRLGVFVSGRDLYRFALRTIFPKTVPSMLNANEYFANQLNFANVRSWTNIHKRYEVMDKENPVKLSKKKIVFEKKMN